MARCAGEADPHAAVLGHSGAVRRRGAQPVVGAAADRPGDQSRLALQPVDRDLLAVLPLFRPDRRAEAAGPFQMAAHLYVDHPAQRTMRSEEHTSELQSLMRNSYAVFCLKKKK